MWKNILSVRLLLLFLACSFGLQSEVVLTDEEYEIITKALEISEQELILSNEKIAQQATLIERQADSIERSDLTIIGLSTAYETLLTSLRMQKNETILNNIKSFGTGFVGGFAVNEAMD